MGKNQRERERERSWKGSGSVDVADVVDVTPDAARHWPMVTINQRSRDQPTKNDWLIYSRPINESSF